MPESFEWIILSSGLIDGNRIADVIAHTEEYLDSVEYFSWEQFYTKLLIQETKDSYLHYNKRSLNSVYLQEEEKEKILEVMKIIKLQLGVE